MDSFWFSSRENVAQKRQKLVGGCFENLRIDYRCFLMLFSNERSGLKVLCMVNRIDGKPLFGN